MQHNLPYSQNAFDGLIGTRSYPITQSVQREGESHSLQPYEHKAVKNVNKFGQYIIHVNIRYRNR